MIAGHTALGFVMLGLLALALHLRSLPLPLFGAHRRPTDTTLGTAGRGVHGPHIAGVAVVDFAATVAAAAVLASVSRGSLVPWLVLLLTLAEGMHWLFGVPTSTFVWLFGEPD